MEANNIDTETDLCLLCLQLRLLKNISRRERQMTKNVTVRKRVDVDRTGQSLSIYVY